MFSVGSIDKPRNGVLIIFLDSGRNFVVGIQMAILD
jgi:hypothetical protein